MTKRLVLYFIGLNLIAGAVVLNIRYDLGVAAFSSVMYAISQIYGISLGTASILCYLIFVVIQCLLSRRITAAYLLEVPLSFAFGWLTDLYDLLIPALSLALWLRILLFSLTMFVTSLGVFLCVKTDLVLTPTDGIVQTISQVFRLRFSLVKNAFDISLVAITLILCLVNRTPLYGIGLGTILSALCLGRIIRLLEGHVLTDYRPGKQRKAGSADCRPEKQREAGSADCRPGKQTDSGFKDNAAPMSPQKAEK